MKRKTFLALIAAMSLASSAFAFNKPVTIADQGSFMAGGTVITENGKTLHGDHAYVFYQIPVKAKKYPLIFLHGAGQSGKLGKLQQMAETAFKIFSLNAAIKLLLLTSHAEVRRGYRQSQEIISPHLPTTFRTIRRLSNAN